MIHEVAALSVDIVNSTFERLNYIANAYNTQTVVQQLLFFFIYHVGVELFTVFIRLPGTC